MPVHRSKFFIKNQKTSFSYCTRSHTTKASEEDVIFSFLFVNGPSSGSGASRISKTSVVSVIVNHIRKQDDNGKFKELLCRVFFDTIEKTPCSQFLPIRDLNKENLLWSLPRSGFISIMIKKKCHVQVNSFERCCHVSQKRRPGSFDECMNLDMKGSPSTDSIERAKNFFMTNDSVSNVRAYVSDTNKRIAELKHANSLEFETYLDNVTVSWRCRLPYAIYKWIVRRFLYTRFAFQSAPSIAKLLCCCIFCPRCCCGRRSHDRVERDVD